MFARANTLTDVTFIQNDGRWSSIVHGLSISQEIEEFKSRIERASALFLVCLKETDLLIVFNTHIQNLAVINLAQGLDTIVREIESVQKLQQDQLVSLMVTLFATCLMTHHQAKYQR